MIENEFMTISTLPVKTALSDTDKLAVDDGVHTFQITGAQLREFLKINSAPMGTVSFSQSPKKEDNPGRLPLFTGDVIPKANLIYPDFFVWLGKHPELLLSDQQYEERLAEYGECPFYVRNTATGAVRLPILANFIKAANRIDGIIQKDAALPNITATWPAIFRHSGDQTVQDSFTGAASISEQNLNIATAEHHKYYDYESKLIEFNANKSSAIYGRNETVLPKHTTLYPWVAVINYAVPASVAENSALLDILTAEGGILGRVIALEEELAALKNNTEIIGGDNVVIEEISDEEEQEEE